MSDQPIIRTNIPPVSPVKKPAWPDEGRPPVPRPPKKREEKYKRPEEEHQSEDKPARQDRIDDYI